MAEIAIAGEARSEFGKGFARRARAEGKIPAVIYGHGEEIQHIVLPAHDLMKALRAANVLLNVTVDGKSQLVLPKDVQRDPVRRTLEHVDLLLVRRGEKVTVDVPIVTSGEVVGGTVLDQQLTTLSVLAEATHIPTQFVVDIDKKEEGFQVFSRDIVLPEGTELAGDPDILVLHVSVTRGAEAEAGEAAEAEAGATEASDAE